MIGPWINSDAQRLVAGFGDGPCDGPRLDLTMLFFGAAIFFLFGVFCYGLFVPKKYSDLGSLVVVYVGLTGLCFILQHEYRPRLRQFGLSCATFRSRRTLAWVGAGLALTGADLGFIYGFGYLVLIILPPHRAFTVGLQPVSRVVRQPFGFIIAVVISPVLEEVFTRGYLYLVLRQNSGRRRAALISSAVFAAMHFGEPLVVVVSFFASLIYIYLDNKARSLAPSIAAHASYNLVLNVVRFGLT